MIHTLTQPCKCNVQLVFLLSFPQLPTVVKNLRIIFVNASPIKYRAYKISLCI